MHSLDSSEAFYAQLESALPPVFTREEASRLTGGLFKPRTLTNIDYRGSGPEVRVRIGKKVGYERDSFIQWLRQYRPYQENEPIKD